MKDKNKEIENIIDVLKATNKDFVEKMKNKSFEMGVMFRIEDELTPIEVLRARGQEQLKAIEKEGRKAIPVIDTGDDEDSWWEGYMTAGKYFKSLRKNSLGGNK